MTLDDLILETWADFAKLQKNPLVAENIVPDSLPILWFGDLDKYLQSDLRVLTLSKNPSDAEFGQNDRFENLSALTEYKTQLNHYFQHHPNKWFRQLNKFLPVFEASYQNGKNTALHADLFTPIATKPVWPGLTREQQSKFDSKIRQLTDILQPDIILTSLSAANLKILFQKLGATPQLIFEQNEPGKSAKYVRAYKVGSIIVINGRNFQGTG